MLLDGSDIQACVAFISGHAGWACPVVFGISLAKSIVFVSLFVPGGITFLRLVGGLVGVGALPWTILIWAAAGTALGYLVSFLIGWYIGPGLIRSWPLLHNDLCAT